MPGIVNGGVNDFWQQKFQLNTDNGRGDRSNQR
jgi:hypothetical protein